MIYDLDPHPRYALVPLKEGQCLRDVENHERQGL